MAFAAAHASPVAHGIVADAIAAEGMGWRNLAENVRAGGTPNAWIRFALRAADAALNVPRDEG